MNAKEEGAGIPTPVNLLITMVHLANQGSFLFHLLLYSSYNLIVTQRVCYRHLQIWQVNGSRSMKIRPVWMRITFELYYDLLWDLQVLLRFINEKAYRSLSFRNRNTQENQVKIFCTYLQKGDFLPFIHSLLFLQSLLCKKLRSIGIPISIIFQ